MTAYSASRGVVAALVLYLVACSEPVTVSDVAAADADATVDVTTVTLKAQPWTYTVSSYGQLTVADTVVIGVESPGTVREVAVVDGQRVQAGDLLFSLDDKKQALRLERAKAGQAEASVQLEQSLQTLARFRSLREQGAASEDQLLQATTNYEAMAARLHQAQAALDIAATELAERRVTSPVNGTVESESVETGQQVQPGQQLVVIQADGALQAIAHINETELLQVRPGQVAEVSVAGQTYPAAVESVGQSANPQTGNYSVKLRLQSAPEHLREGMSARVQLTLTSSREVLWVPATVLVDRHRRQVVFVAEDGRAVERKVTFGLPEGERLPVLSGLAAGEEVIVSPLPLITDGTRIRVEND